MIRDPKLREAVCDGYRHEYENDPLFHRMTDSADLLLNELRHALDDQGLSHEAAEAVLTRLVSVALPDAEKRRAQKKLDALIVEALPVLSGLNCPDCGAGPGARCAAGCRHQYRQEAGQTKRDGADYLRRFWSERGAPSAS